MISLESIETNIEIFTNIYLFASASYRLINKYIIYNKDIDSFESIKFL